MKITETLCSQITHDDLNRFPFFLDYVNSKGVVTIPIFMVHVVFCFPCLSSFTLSKRKYYIVSF